MYVFADTSECVDTTTTSSDISQIGNLEIHVELPSRNREKKTKTQQDIEMAFKRRLNRDIKERQVFLHKASLLCHFGRIFFYNRLLNDPSIMPKVLKLLPSKSAYPPEQGTEIKYFQSMVTWFKSAIKLKTQNLYPEKSAAKTKAKAHIELLKQIEKKEARSKQDMIFIFIILLRGMGLQCRLIVNMQPLPLKPPQSDLLTIKIKKDDESHDKNASVSSKNIKKLEQDSDTRTDTELKPSSSKVKVTKQESLEREHKREAAKKISKNPLKKSDSKEDYFSSDNSNAERQQQAKSKAIKKTKKKSSAGRGDGRIAEPDAKSISISDSKAVNSKKIENRENNKDNKSESCDKNVKHTKKEKANETNVKHIHEKTKTSSSSAKPPKQTDEDTFDRSLM